MAVLMETDIGDFVIDLFVEESETACENFLKLCKIKYYHNCLFYSIQKDFVASTGDPTNTGKGGSSIYGLIEEEKKKKKNAKKYEESKEQSENTNDRAKADRSNTELRFVRAEVSKKLKHDKIGLIAMENCVKSSINLYIGSRFYITLKENLSYLDEKHVLIGEIAEGLELVQTHINQAYVDERNFPLQNIRIKRMSILEDPFTDPPELPDLLPPKSPEPIADEVLAPFQEEEDELKLLCKIAEKEAKSRAITLEILGDIPDADLAPPENVLFVCKLNPITQEDDLKTIFARFGIIKSCALIKDWKTGDSLQYAFIEFSSKKSCENAYFKMQNVLIDDRRIHVDFCQSALVEWRRYKRFGINGGNLEIEEKEKIKADKFIDKHKFKFNYEKQRGNTDGNKEKSYPFLFKDNDYSRKKKKVENIKSEEKISERKKEREKGNEREKERGNEREKERREEREKERREERGNEREKQRKEEREKERGNEREKERREEREKERREEREKERREEREKERGNEREKQRGNEREKERRGERGNGREKEKCNEREKERDNEREKERDNEREKERREEREKERREEREKERREEREKERRGERKKERREEIEKGSGEKKL